MRGCTPTRALKEHGPAKARRAFRRKSNCVLEISGQVSSDLRLMMLASAAGVDLALKQDDA
jgi:hypothetical protein